MKTVTLHMARKVELELLGRLEVLGHGLHWKPKDPMVFLVQGFTEGESFLFATDGTVIRVQRIQLFRSAAALRAWQDGHGSLPLSSLAAWVDLEDEEADFESLELPLRLQASPKVTRGSMKDWESVWAAVDQEEVGIPSLLLQARLHLRPFPDQFSTWLVMLRPATMAAFAASFPKDLEPSVLFVSEPQVDTQKPALGMTWAKYWAFHAVTLEPLGVVIGVRSPELVKKITEKRGAL